MAPGVGSVDHDYGFGDAASPATTKSITRGRSSPRGRDDHASLNIRDRSRSRSQSRGRSVPRRMSIKTPTRSKMCVVVDPLSMTSSKQTLNSFFNDSGSNSTSSLSSPSTARGVANCSAVTGGLELEEDHSEAEDEAMMLPDSTQVETKEHENNRQKHHHQHGTKDASGGRKRTEVKMRNHNKPPPRSKTESSDATPGRSKDRHHRTSSKSPSRHQQQQQQHPTKSPHSHRSRVHGARTCPCPSRATARPLPKR